MKRSSAHDLGVENPGRAHPSQFVMLIETFPTTMAVTTLAALGWLAFVASGLLHAARPIMDSLHAFAVWATVALPPVFVVEPIYRSDTDKTWPPYGPRV